MLRPRTIRPIVSALLLTALLAPAAASGQISRTATLRTTVLDQAKLTLSSASLTFPDADPDTVPQIIAGGGPLTIVAKARTRLNRIVTLTILASDDLRSGTDVIPASALSWTATGAGFVAGTAANGIAQPAGSWTNSGNRTGTQTWRLANPWSYATGTYTLTLTYTLTAP